uniref:Nucleoprotein TPR n=1 Tax=Pavo cristatus TaxID=9049 RepID=A0A8C9FKG8_PAVCR
MAAVLQQVLERAELAKLSKPVQGKLERFLADQQSEIDGLRARHERFKVDSEQQYFEVEKRLAQSQERLVNETQECQTLREELKKLREYYFLNSSSCFFCISARPFVDFICFMHKNFHSSLPSHTAITRNPVAVWISISQLKGKGMNTTVAALGSCVILLSLLCCLLDILHLMTKRAILSEEELAAMSPTAAAVAKVVKPGMKLTELYNAYVETQDQLLLEKLENKRINKYLDEIVQEVEAKAPILKRQREEFERSQKAVASLSAKLEQAMKEIQRLQEDADKANKQTSVLERENQRLEIQVKDLSQQKCVTLVSLAIILLKTTGLGFRISELQSQLDEALNELEKLRESRHHQLQLVESIVRQRDMFRILLAQTTGAIIPLQASGMLPEEISVTSTPKRSSIPQAMSTPAPVSVSESVETAEAKAALKQLQEVFENYKKEKAENDKLLNEQNEKLQEQVTELRSQNAKISTQLEFASKRYEMLQDNVEGYRREITSLHERTQKLTATTQKQEQIINTITQDLRGANEKLAVAEVRAENLKKEKDILKMSDVRLTQQRESLLVEQRGQNLLLTNLRTIQGILERSETETKQRLSNQVEKLEREISQLKKKLESEVEQRHALTKNQEVHILDLKRQLETETNRHINTKELLKNAQKETTVLKQQLNNTEAQLASQSSQRAPGKGQPGTSEDVDDLISQLRQADEQVNDLRERLKTSSSNVEQYRAMVLSLEESLNKEKQVTEEVRATVEARLKESSEYQAQLEKKLMESEKEKQELQEEKRKAVENMEQQVHVIYLHCSKKEIAETRFEVAQVESLRFRQRVEHLERELQEVQDSLNAEREKVQVWFSINVYDVRSRGLLSMFCFLSLLPHLLSQQKDADLEEYRKLLSEKEANTKRIQQMSEETGRLKAEIARTNASLTTSQNLLQNLKDEVAKIRMEKETLQKELDAKVADIQEKVKTITQVKKIGRRYKTQYEELKAQHDKMVAEAATQSFVEQQEEQVSVQEVQELKDSLSQSEGKIKTLENQVENLQKTVAEKETEARNLQEQVSQLQSELARFRQDLQEKTTQEEQLRQQITEKEEKTRKTFLAAKQKIAQFSNSKSLKMNISEYDNIFKFNIFKICFLCYHDESNILFFSASTSDPPTANIKPTPVVSTPSKVTAAAIAGNKSTPRASIRPMVTPATVTNPTTTPTATVMPTTQVETQEAMQSEGPVEHVPVFGSTSGSVRSTSPNVQTSLSQPILTVQQQTQATAFVQPTQQSHPQIEPANQEPSPTIVEVVQSSQIERPSTSTAVFGTGWFHFIVSATPSSSLSKRPREEEEDSTVENSDQISEETVDVPLPKKLRSIQRVGPEEEVTAEESTDGEVEAQTYNQDSQDSIGEVRNIHVHSGQDSHQVSLHPQVHLYSQKTGVFMILSQDYEDEEEEDEDDDEDTGMGDEGDDSNEGTGSADGNDGYEADDAEGADGTDPGTETEESMGGGESNQRAADSQNSCEGSTSAAESTFPQESSREQQPSSASERQAPRPPQSPRRPPHPLPPRLTIHAPPQELGPPVQSTGRCDTSQQHFFDDEDRTVPSTPTLVVPHRTDGFAEAIHSPQVAGVPRFRFGPPEDMPQTSSSHSDLGQLASQGGLGMYETPLFLAHEEESGGRSVPTTPLQVAAPVTVFTESTSADASEHASQSVPMVTTSTGNLSTTTEAGAGDDGDEVFAEAESEGITSEAGLEIDSQQEEESVQASDESDLPSTSQDPPSSSSADTSSNQLKLFRRVRLQPPTLRTGVRGRQFNRQRGNVSAEIYHLLVLSRANKNY